MMRRSWKAAIAGVVATALLGTALAGWGFLVEPSLLTLAQVRIAAPGWPAGRPPLRIALLADLHVGAPHVDLAKLDTVVARFNALTPDLVLLGGDYVIHGVLFGRFTPPEAIAARLAGLRARHGVFAVLGNHDWWLDGGRVSRSLAAAGIPVLENQAIAIGMPGSTLWLAGIADDTTRQPQVAATLAQVPPGEPVIVLAHDPAIFPEIPPGPLVTLAGHTHGGQVYLPLYGAPIIPGRAPRRYAYGHVREAGRDLVVTAGIGTSILPIRLNRPPEITLVTIEPARGPEKEGTSSPTAGDEASLREDQPDRRGTVLRSRP